DTLVEYFQRDAAGLREHDRTQFRRADIFPDEAPPIAIDDESPEQRQSHAEARAAPGIRMPLSLVAAHLRDRGAQLAAPGHRAAVVRPRADVDCARHFRDEFLQQRRVARETASREQDRRGSESAFFSLDFVQTVKSEIRNRNSIQNFNPFLLRYRGPEQRVQFAAAFGGRGVQARDYVAGRL